MLGLYRAAWRLGGQAPKSLLALRDQLAQAASQNAAAQQAAMNAYRDSIAGIKKEILGHLIDSAADNHQRFVRARFADPFVWPGYDQRDWVSLHRYRERPWGELVDLWVAMNRQVAAVIEAAPAGKLQTSCLIGAHEPAPLEWWMRDYLRHVKHHLEQLEGA